MRLTAGEIEQRAREAAALLSPCQVCPRMCRSLRDEGQTGWCGVGAVCRVATWGPHFGEEPPLVGPGGSGAVFFAGCNLSCAFCQNADVSTNATGVPVSAEGLAAIALELQDRGCSNLNLVTPTHVMPQILAALALARRERFELPVVWNCGGYDSLPSLRLLEGVVDVYMPDFKFADARVAQRLSNVRNYPQVARAALREMHRQVGDLVLDEHGIALRGVLVRHLVLPEGLAGTDAVARFLARELSPATWVNVMDQYRPAHRAGSLLGMDRRPTRDELTKAAASARRHGLHRGIFPDVEPAG